MEEVPPTMDISLGISGFPRFISLSWGPEYAASECSYEHILRPAILTTVQIFLQHSAKNKYLGSRLDGDPCLGKTGSKYF